MYSRVKQNKSNQQQKRTGARTRLESNSWRCCAKTLSTQEASAKVTKPKPLLRNHRKRK